MPTVATVGVVACPFDWPEVKGIHVGGCVDPDGGWHSSTVVAHAHNKRGDAWFGVICVRSESQLYVATPHPIVFPATGPSGDFTGWARRPSRLAWHEYCHLLTPGHGHDDAWRAVMRRFGQPIPAQYQKRRMSTAPACPCPAG